LLNARARHYDASAARFLSRDPILRFDPQSVEPYAYPKGNPLRYVDPLGTEENAKASALYAKQRGAITMLSRHTFRRITKCGTKGP